MCCSDRTRDLSVNKYLMPTAIFLGLGIGLGIWVRPSIATGKDQMWHAQAAGTCAAPGDTKVHITLLFRLLKWIQNLRPCVRLSPSCTSRSWERSDVLNSVLPNVPHVFYCYSAVMHGALSTCFVCLLEDWLGVTMALHVGVSLEWSYSVTILEEPLTDFTIHHYNLECLFIICSK